MKEVISAILLLFAAATAVADAPTKTVYPLVTDTEELQDDTPYYILIEQISIGEGEFEPLWFNCNMQSFLAKSTPTATYFIRVDDNLFKIKLYTKKDGTTYFLNNDYTGNINQSTEIIAARSSNLSESSATEYKLGIDEDGSVVIILDGRPDFRLSIDFLDSVEGIYAPYFVRDNVESRPKIYISTAPEGVTKLANAPILEWKDDALKVESPDGLPLVYRFVETHSMAESFDGEWNDWSWENSIGKFSEISKGEENKLLQMKCVDKGRNLESEISAVEVSPDHPLTGLIDPVVESNSEVYNLQGIKVSQSSLVPGSVYIRVSAGCSEKFVHM